MKAVAAARHDAASAANRATVAAARDLKRESGAEKPSRIRSGLG